MSRLRRILRERWAERQQFLGTTDWLKDLYGRVVYRLRKYPLPLRFAPCRFRLATIDERPFYARLGTSDLAVLREIFVEGEYAELFTEVPSSATLVVDLGANVGFSARLWLERFPQARVIAVEPDADNIAVARLNNSAKELADRVTWVQACAAATERTVYLDRSDDAWGFSMTDGAEGNSSGGNSKVAAETAPSAGGIPALRMESILKRGGIDEGATIDLLKCDIEGAEEELFGDCRAWIQQVRHLVVEVHLPYDAKRLEADLQSAGASFDLKVIATDVNHQVLFGKNRTVP